MNRVEIEHDGGIAVLRLNRPDVLNAIDQAMWMELLDAFRTVAATPSVRVCLLTGNGRGFCSGADLGESAWHGETPDRSRARIDGRNQQVAREMIRLAVPVIACINGYALGGGLEIALAADIRIASRTAKMGFPEAAIGRFVTGGASLLLPRAVGLSRAKRLLYTSEHIDAGQALAIGLVDEVTEPADLMPRAPRPRRADRGLRAGGGLADEAHPGPARHRRAGNGAGARDRSAGGDVLRVGHRRGAEGVRRAAARLMRRGAGQRKIGEEPGASAPRPIPPDYVASLSASRGSGFSSMGQWTMAANTPKKIPAHHIMSYEPVRS